MAFFATAWTIACITYGSAVPSGAQRHSLAARWPLHRQRDRCCCYRVTRRTLPMIVSP